MTSDTRILFTDLDGTMLNDQKEITPGNQAAVDAALREGHKIVVSTGRPLASGKMVAERIGLTREGCYVISFNGSQIYDMYHQKTVYEKTFPMEIGKKIYRDAMAQGIHIHAYSDTHVLSVKDTEELHRYVKGTGMPYQIVPDVEAAFVREPHKILAISFDDRPKLERFREKVLEEFGDTVESFFSNNAYLEIVPRGVSKGFAVRWMCEYLGIPLENSVAAGDAPNDIEMLEAAHVGAVMQNAFPGVKEHGDYVTERDNNHDGAAEIIEKFILRK